MWRRGSVRAPRLVPSRVRSGMDDPTDSIDRQEAQGMKPSRQFRPLAPVALEDRAVPSQAAAHVAAAAAAAAAKKGPPAHVATAQAKTPAATFPMDIADTIAAGQPVN